MESIVVTKDLIYLTPEERIKFYVQVCESMGLNPLTRPLQYFEQIDKNGNHSLILYALRAASAKLAMIYELSVAVEKEEEDDQCISYKSTVTNKNGRSYSAIGAVSLKGRLRSDAKMFAQTKANRRAILDFVGCGLLDETEIEGMNGAPVEMKSDLLDSYVPPPAAPEPSSAPATEVVEKVAKPAAPVPAATSTPPLLEKLAATQVESQTMDQVVARLNTYRRDVLQRGGMMPAKGLGIAAKWQKFIARKIKEKTVAEYVAVLAELDTVLAKSQDRGVVEFIEKEIA